MWTPSLEGEGSMLTRKVLVAVAMAVALPLHARADAQQDAIVDELYAGNRKFVVAPTSALPDTTQAVRSELAAGQHPKAIVVSCADSRVPPELIFHQGLGDLFVERVAGNVAAGAVIASAEYAVEHLGARVLMVMGHHKCGAVAAAVDQVKAPSHLTDALDDLVAQITPAVKEAAATLAPGGDLVHDAVHANARLVAQNLLDRSALLREKLEAGELKIVVAVYDLATGVVTPEDVALVAR
jgi:carbonic anhydrase